MNIDEVYKNGGGVYIPNPNYNKKTAKLGVQPQILTKDVTKAENPLLTNMYDAAKTSWVMDNKESYQRYGITPNKISNMDKERWERQSNWAKLGNAVLQSAVSEVGLGTIIGVSDLFDFVGQAVTGNLGNQDYNNPVSQYLEGVQDKFNNEIAPIYSDPNLNIANGGLLDIGWYASNMPSIMSSLTLLIPSTGAVKGLSYLGKATKLFNGVRKAVNWAGKSSKAVRAMNTTKGIARANRFIENGLTAAMSRTMENYQEARGVYQDMYSEAYNHLNEMTDKEYNDYINKNKETFKDVDTKDKNAVAKHIASTSANQDFKENYINTVSDVIELYALKDVFGRGRLAQIARKSARQAQRKSLMFPGMTKVEADASWKKLPFMKRAKYNTIDALVGSKLAITAQLNEGFEEGVNYISQQEGMHTGRVMLGTENPNPWDYRYGEYFRNPQLYESAFWGVLGGVVFQAGGSKLHRISNTIKNKKSDNKNFKTKETGEERPTDGWLSLSDLPEVQRMKADIEGRSEKMNDLAAKLSAIYDKKINPFDEKGGKLETKEEQDAAAALAKDIYINNLTISAINNGTYDMTRAYFADDNVKKAFKEKGIIKNNENSDAWQQDVLAKMDKIAESYDVEIDKLSALQSANDKDVPIEFLQIAASENVNHNINIDSLKRQRESYYNDYATKKQEANLDENPMYEKAMELEVKINNLYRLYDQRRSIEEEVKKTKLLTSRIALDSINKTIKKEQEELGNDKNLSAADILFSLGNVYSHNKKAREIDADLEKLITDTVNTGDFKSLEEFLGLKEGRFNKIQNEEDLTAFKKEYFDKNKAYKDAMTKLNELGDGNTSLKTSYQKAVYLDTLIRGEEAIKINTVEDFQSWIGFKNNTFNEARRNAINSSYKTIGDVTRNHRDHLDELSEYFKSKIDGTDTQVNLDFLTPSEASNLDKAMTVLNLTDPRNETIGPIVAATFDANSIDDEDADGEEETNDEDKSNKEKSKTQNKAVESNETKGMNNLSPTPSEGSGTQGNEQIEGNEQPETQEQEENSMPSKVKINTSNGINIIKVNDDEEGYNVVKNQDGTYSIDLSNVTTPDILNNEELFDVVDGVDFMADNWKITSNPTIDFDSGNKLHVITHGTIELKNDPNEGSNGVEQESTPVEEGSSSTPQPTTQPAPAKSQQSEEGKQDDSSTGELDLNSTDEADQNLIQSIRASVSRYANPLDPNPDYDKARTETLKDYAEAGGTRDITKAVEQAIEANKKAHDTFAKMTALQGSAANLAFAARSIDYSKDSEDIFDKAIEAFVENYAKNLIVPKINGKYVIKLEDIFRICTEHYENKKALANEMYESIRDYLLNSNKAKAAYIVIDKQNLKSSDFINSLDKTKDEILNENQDVNSTRVNINTLRDFYQDEEYGNSQQLGDYENVMNNLQVGDTVHAEVSGREVVISAKTSYGREVIIATVPIPYVNNNKFVVYNEGWRTDIPLNGISKFENFIADLFTADSGSKNDVLKIITKCIIDGNISSDNLEDFSKNPYIESLVKQSRNEEPKDRFIKLDKQKNPDYRKLLSHLIKLYNFTTQSDTATKEENKKRIKFNIHAWTEKLLKDYTTISSLKKSMDVEVTSINEGEINRIVDNPDEEYDKLNRPTQAFSENLVVNKQINLGIVTSTENITISGEPGVRPISNFVENSVVISVNSRNSQPDYVAAKALRLTSEDLKNNTGLSEIFRAVGSHISDFFSSGSTTAYNDFDNFIANIFAINNVNVKSRPAVFRASSGSIHIYNNSTQDKNVLQKDLVFNIGKGNELCRIRFYFNLDGTFKGYAFNKTGPWIAVGNKATSKQQMASLTLDGKLSIDKVNSNQLVQLTVKALADVAQKFCTIDVSRKGIVNDSTRGDLGNGFFKWNDNKLVVDIPSSSKNAYHKEYDSYSDFIISNDLVKVNTFIGENGRNFHPIGERTQLANQVMKVGFPSTSNVQQQETAKTATVDYIDNEANKDDYQKNKEIVTSKEEHKGVKLAEQVFGDEVITDLRSQANEAGFNFDDLFPDVIKYDAKKNYRKKENGKVVEKGSIAETASQSDSYYTVYRGDSKHSSGRKIRKGTVVIGSQMLNLLSSNNRSKQIIGVRKLIHEKLHIILHNDANQGNYDNLVKEMQAIRDEFDKHLTEDISKAKEAKDLKRLEVLNRIKSAIDYKKSDTRMEEFIVESITNKDYFDYLNSIDSINKEDKTKKESIITKIANFIAKIFGWNIKDNSLYTDVLKAFNNAINNSDNTSISEERDDFSNMELDATADNSTVLTDENDLSDDDFGLPIAPQNDDYNGENEDDDFSGLNAFMNEHKQDDSSSDDFNDFNDFMDDITTNNAYSLEKDDNETIVTSLSDIHAILPKEVKSDFNRLTNNGNINITCSI